MFTRFFTLYFDEKNSFYISSSFACLQFFDCFSYPPIPSFPRAYCFLSLLYPSFTSWSACLLPRFYSLTLPSSAPFSIFYCSFTWLRATIPSHPFFHPRFFLSRNLALSHAPFSFSSSLHLSLFSSLVFFSLLLPRRLLPSLEMCRILLCQIPNVTG